jgi:arginine/lysine/ornithine decarboxylase
MIRLAFDNPSTASGDISISADAARETYKKLSAKMTLTGSLHTQDANIEFKDIRANIMADASASRYYGFLEALDIG